MTLRNPEVAPVVTRDEETAPRANSEDDIWRHTTVTNAETAASITFADIEEVAQARRLLDDTDFASETVFIEQREIGECFEQELCWVHWTESSIETDYVTRYRDADVACDAEAKDVVADLMRLPVALDAEQIRRYSSSSGSGHCRTPSGREGNA